MSLTPTSTANNCVAPSSYRLHIPLASVSTPLFATTGFVSAFALPYIYMCLHLVFLSYVLEVLCIKVSCLSCNSDAAISRDPHTRTPVLFPLVPHHTPSSHHLSSLFSPLCPTLFRLWSAGFRFFTSLVIYLCTRWIWLSSRSSSCRDMDTSLGFFPCGLDICTCIS